MENTIKKRIVLFKKFIKILVNKKNLKKSTLLGEGGVGIVFSFCDKKLCCAVKKSYLEKKEYKHIDFPFTKLALKHQCFIELVAMKLTNELVLQNICPNFILNYDYEFTERVGICTDIYKFSSKLYNEYLDNIDIYTEWVKETHTIQQWYNAYFQITIAIYCMQRHFNMTHLDLHSDNVLVCKVKPGGYWKYTINDIVYNVPNLGYLFYINDFGHAFIPSQLQSWFGQEKSKSKKITKNYDIFNLFDSTLKFSTSPQKFKNRVKYIVKELKNEKNFLKIINEIWFEYTFDQKGKCIEKYNLDKNIDAKNLPKEIRKLVLHSKTAKFE